MNFYNQYFRRITLAISVANWFYSFVPARASSTAHSIHTHQPAQFLPTAGMRLGYPPPQPIPSRPSRPPRRSSASPASPKSALHDVAPEQHGNQHTARPRKGQKSNNKQMGVRCEGRVGVGGGVGWGSVATTTKLQTATVDKAAQRRCTLRSHSHPHCRNSLQATYIRTLTHTRPHHPQRLGRTRVHARAHTLTHRNALEKYLVYSTHMTHCKLVKVQLKALCHSLKKIITETSEYSTC